MKIQVASDLHLENLARQFPGERVISPAPNAEVLVLAGDIGGVAQVINLFNDWPVPVLYVLGNHEFWHSCLESVREHAYALSQGTSVQIMECATVHYGAVRFLGTTLWTDYGLRSPRTPAQLKTYAGVHLPDHHLIETRSGQLFSPAHAHREHEAAVAWLRAELAQPFCGKTVVISHHGPHPRSIHPRHIGDLLNAAFVSDLSRLMPFTDVWLHGHVHDSVDYQELRCRVVSNPLGSALNQAVCRDSRKLRFENPQFQADFCIEV